MHAVRDSTAAGAPAGGGPLSGFVQATFAYSTLVDHILAMQQTADLHLVIADVTDVADGPAGALVYTSPNVVVGPVLRATEVDVGGRTWRFSASPATGAALQSPIVVPLLVLVAGLLVTVLVMALLALGLARRQLRSARARAREELVAMVSHDLRSPATSLINGAELLLAQNLSAPEQHEVLVGIVREGRRLSTLLNDFLEVHQVGTGRLPVAPRSIDLRSLLTYTVMAAGEDPAALALINSPSVAAIEQACAIAVAGEGADVEEVRPAAIELAV